jgi:hypothetical protein
MSWANDAIGETRRLMCALRQIRDRSGMTLAAAEVAWRAMPDRPLSPQTVRSILAAVIQRQAADPAFLVWQAWSEGVYWDQAYGDRESYWAPIVPVDVVAAESCQIIGLVAGAESMEGTTSISSDSCGLSRIADSDSIEAGVWQSVGTDPIVYEVLLDCRGLDRRQTGDLIRGLVEWDACLDLRGLDARQWTWRHELRCDREDCDQDDVVGLFPDGTW